ncbi:Zinc-binding protein A33 [Labeo rohita]|uniref:Zinc-binding protein A33 n=1 Tax=Labeo rohita TaxID=84645 RepID=A0ABQ8LP97_LABRO|nr:Zinc-binding protein A33 [Labeo rohita]
MKRQYPEKDSHQFTLDPNTVSTNLRLSEGNRVVTYTDTQQPYPDHPDRFDEYLQVLCRESVSGRCYWEVDFSFWHKDKYTNLPVSSSCSRIRVYVDHSAGTLSFYSVSDTMNLIHTVQTTFTQPLYPGFDHHSAGTLSFYSVSDTMNLIHTVQTTFTQPLYPGFVVCDQSSAKLC